MDLKYSKIENYLNAAVLVSDYLFVVLVLNIFRFIRARTDLIPGLQLPINYIPEFWSYMVFTLAAGLAFVFIGFTLNLYFNRQKMAWWNHLYSLVITVIFWIAALSTYFYFTRDLFFSRLVLVYSCITLAVLLSLSRVVLWKFRKYLEESGILIKRVWIVTSDKDSSDIEKLISNGFENYKIVSVFDSSSLLSQDKDVFERRYIVDNPDLLIIDAKLRSVSEGFIIKCCQTYGIEYMFFTDIYTKLSERKFYASFLDDKPYIVVYPTVISPFWSFVKRLIDFIFALFFLILLSPIFLIFSICSVIAQGFPIFVDLKRVGIHGKHFSLYKFRSMVNNAQDLKSSLEHMNERDGKLFKIKNDPRITAYGRFIRKWSIDELPQLVNVLKGQMSFIGPRPHEPKEVNKYSLDEIRLLSVRPGITSYYATIDRKISFDKEVEHELYYIENWSLILDAYIFLKTILVVLKGTGE